MDCTLETVWLQNTWNNTWCLCFTDLLFIVTCIIWARVTNPWNIDAKCYFECFERYILHRKVFSILSALSIIALVQQTTNSIPLYSNLLCKISFPRVKKCHRIAGILVAKKSLFRRVASCCEPDGFFAPQELHRVSPTLTAATSRHTFCCLNWCCSVLRSKRREVPLLSSNPWGPVSWCSWKKPWPSPTSSWDKKKSISELFVFVPAECHSVSRCHRF